MCQVLVSGKRNEKNTIMMEMQRGRRKRKKRKGKEKEEEGHMFVHHFPLPGWMSKAAGVSAGLQ